MARPNRRSSAALLAKKRYNPLQLSITQEQAITLLLSGQRDQKVADELGIHRVTVTRWRLYHPAFKAVLNQRRRLLVEGIQDKLQALLDAAVDTLLDIVRTPGPEQTTVASDVFHRGLAFGLTFGSSGETDPDMIVEREATARAERYEALRRARDLGQVTNFDWEATHEDLLWKANEPSPEEPKTWTRWWQARLVAAA